MNRLEEIHGLKIGETCSCGADDLADEEDFVEHLRSCTNDKTLEQLVMLGGGSCLRTSFAWIHEVFFTLQRMASQFGTEN